MWIIRSPSEEELHHTLHPHSQSIKQRAVRTEQASSLSFRLLCSAHARCLYFVIEQSVQRRCSLLISFIIDLVIFRDALHFRLILFELSSCWVDGTALAFASHRRATMKDTDHLSIESKRDRQVLDIRLHLEVNQLTRAAVLFFLTDQHHTESLSSIDEKNSLWSASLLSRNQIDRPTRWRIVFFTWFQLYQWSEAQTDNVVCSSVQEKKEEEENIVSIMIALSSDSERERERESERRKEKEDNQHWPFEREKNVHLWQEYYRLFDIDLVNRKFHMHIFTSLICRQI